LLIHDFEGFGAYSLGEASVDEGIRVGMALINADDRGPLLAALAAHHSQDVDEASLILESNYQGHHDSFADFAEWLAEECGDLRNVPDHIKRYIDWDGLGRDLEISGDFYSIEVDGESGIHIFQGG